MSRRSVLRKSTLLASLGAVGLPALTGPAAATNECPRTIEDWEAHWADDYFGDSVDVPPAGTMTKSDMRTVLTATPPDDAVTSVAKQYLVTYLNLLKRRDPDPPCSNKEVAVDGIGDADWEEVKNAAQHWLRLKDWDGSPRSGFPNWSPSVPVGNTDGTVDGEVLKDALAAFNDAAFDRLDCDCDDVQRESIEQRRADCTGDGDGSNGTGNDCVDRGSDTSWHSSDPPTYALRSTEATDGPGRIQLSRDGIQKFLGWLR